MKIPSFTSSSEDYREQKPFTDRIFYLSDDSLVHFSKEGTYWFMYTLASPRRIVQYVWCCEEVSLHYDTLYAHIAARNPELLLQEPL